jgi:hypothetical protein
VLADRPRPAGQQALALVRPCPRQARLCRQREPAPASLPRSLRRPRAVRGRRFLSRRRDGQIRPSTSPRTIATAGRAASAHRRERENFAMTRWRRARALATSTTSFRPMGRRPTGPRRRSQRQPHVGPTAARRVRLRWRDPRGLQRRLGPIELRECPDAGTITRRAGMASRARTAPHPGR